MLRRALSFDRKKKPSADDATAPSNGAETARPRTGSHEPVIVSMRRSLSFGRRESLPTNWRRARDDYQRNVESIFDQFLKGMDRQR